ncbi:hypothetical protein BH09BAC1_BH09BAC1_01090 [soil metagenome]
MKLSTWLFWDTDIAQVSFEKDAPFVIPRVFMRGTWDDVMEIWRYYGREKCQQILTATRYLDKKTLAVCCVWFRLEKTDFRCYNLRQSSPKHWDY